jgi:hypothetical protein
MSAPEPDDKKRDSALPPGCKELIDVIRSQPATVPDSLSPITRRVTLPEKDSVGYLAEITGQELWTVIDELVRLRLSLRVNRSLDFDDATKLLRRYGIAADRAV